MFVRLLSNGSGLSATEPKYDLIQLATEQRQAPAQQARQQATARH